MIDKSAHTYTVSRDDRSGMWYAHMTGFSYVPYAGSFCQRKSDAVEYARMLNGMPNRVGEIEERRKAEWRKDAIR